MIKALGLKPSLDVAEIYLVVEGHDVSNMYLLFLAFYEVPSCKAADLFFKNGSVQFGGNMTTNKFI